jgi:hypothetical protein
VDEPENVGCHGYAKQHSRHSFKPILSGLNRWLDENPQGKANANGKTTDAYENPGLTVHLSH